MTRITFGISVFRQVAASVLVILLALPAAHARADMSQSPPGHPIVPPYLAYISALEGYRKYAPEPVQPWRDSLDTVGRIGGWRAYLKETQASGEGAGPGRGFTQHADGKGPD